MPIRSAGTNCSKNTFGMLMASRLASGMKLELDPTFGTAKDIRTGLDTSKSDMGGLVNLLITKGIFTDVEYMEAVAASMKQEHQRWEEEISQMLGTDTVLT
jgi:hypothetical protein